MNPQLQTLTALLDSLSTDEAEALGRQLAAQGRDRQQSARLARLIRLIDGCTGQMDSDEAAEVAAADTAKIASRPRRGGKAVTTRANADHAIGAMWAHQDFVNQPRKLCA